MDKQLETAANEIARLAAAQFDRSAADLEALGREFAPDAVRWGVELAAAQASGDPAGRIPVLTENFDQLALLFVGRLANLGIDARAAGEAWAANALKLAAHAAAAAV